MSNDHYINYISFYSCYITPYQTMRQHPFFHMHKIQQCKFTFQESLDSKTISGYAISILTLSSPFKYAHISFLSRMETPGTRALFQDIPEGRIMLKGLQDFVRSSDALSIRFSFFLSSSKRQCGRDIGGVLLDGFCCQHLPLQICWSSAKTPLKLGDVAPEILHSSDHSGHLSSLCATMLTTAATVMLDAD